MRAAAGRVTARRAVTPATRPPTPPLRSTYVVTLSRQLLAMRREQAQRESEAAHRLRLAYLAREERVVLEGDRGVLAALRSEMEQLRRRMVQESRAPAAVPPPPPPSSPAAAHAHAVPRTPERRPEADSPPHAGTPLAPGPGGASAGAQATPLRQIALPIEQ